MRARLSGSRAEGWMSLLENHAKLHQLRHRWRKGYFGLDAYGVCPIEEAIDEAIAHLSMYDRQIGYNKEDGLSTPLH